MRTTDDFAASLLRAERRAEESAVSPRGRKRFRRDGDGGGGGGERRMKCHVVPGLNVAPRYVIAVRNSIIPGSRIMDKFLVLVSTLCSWRFSLYREEESSEARDTLSVA